MRSRIFVKLMTAFILVIAAAAVTFGISARQVWSGSLIAFIMALLISAVVASSMAHRLQRIVQFADRVAAGLRRAAAATR